MSKGICALSW